jgi:hypothetical protein
MATPIGANTITAVSRRYIIPTVADNVYPSNALIFRLLSMNKKVVQGGFQIEVPLMWQQFAAGGPYQGFDLLDTTPTDTVQNAAFDWKQYDVPVSIDGLSLARADSPDAIANALSVLFGQAQLQMAEFLGQGIWSDAKTNVKAIDGVGGAVDDGTNTATYGGLSRTTFPFWKSQAITTTASFASTGLNDMMTQFGNATAGGRHPTIIFSNQAVYNATWKASTPGQSFPVQPEGHDEQLAQNGFTNMLFNGVPMLVDSHVPVVGADYGSIYFLCEDYFYLYVNHRADFDMREFREPINQDAMVAFLLWMGNLVCLNPSRQAKMRVTAA